MNLKTKIIHLLGGKTQAEYDFINKPIELETKTLLTAKIGATISVINDCEVSENFIKAELAYQIAHELFKDNLIKIQKSNETKYREGKTQYCGSITVVLDGDTE